MHFVHTPQHDVRTFLGKLCCLKYSSLKCKDFENFLFLTPYCVLTTIQWKHETICLNHADNKCWLISDGGRFSLEVQEKRRERPFEKHQLSCGGCDGSSLLPSLLPQPNLPGRSQNLGLFHWTLDEDLPGGQVWCHVKVLETEPDSTTRKTNSYYRNTMKLDFEYAKKHQECQQYIRGKSIWMIWRNLCLWKNQKVQHSKSVKKVVKKLYIVQDTNTIAVQSDI